MMIVLQALGTFEGLGPLGQLAGNSGQQVFGQFENTISLTLAVLTISAGLWFIFQIFGGTLQWLGSGGEKQALQNAQKRIVNAIVGIFLVVMAYTLIAIISSFLGIYILSPFDALLGVNPPGGGFNPGGDPPCVPPGPC